MFKTKYFLFALLSTVIFMACNNEEDPPVPASSATFTVSIENVMTPLDYLASGTTGLIMPGAQEQHTFHAGRGALLSLATMFVQSNDLFYAFAQSGLALYDDNGIPVTGDVTAQIDLWDAGTEVNEIPGSGPNQAPRQSGPDTGPAENGTIRLVAAVNDGFSYPPNEDILRINLSHDGGTEFTLTVENISGNSSLPTPLAPGVWAVHGDGVQLFTAGAAADAGLEGIAEDGNVTATSAALTAATGYVSPLAPGVWVTHEAGETPVFRNGRPDTGQGLKALAEDGDPGPLNTALANAAGAIKNGVFNTPQGAGAPGPLLPGSSYTFTFEAEEGAYLNLATMLVHTNDLFFAFGDEGIALFNNGVPVSGDLTGEILLWDAGTEVNEYPGAGNNQPARGGGQSGSAENGTVKPVNDGFTYPAVNGMVRVSIQIE